MITDLSEIAKLSAVKEEENWAFRQFLLQSSLPIDDMVKALDATITPQIDCTSCGNCCRSLMIEVTPEDAKRTAAGLGITVADFENQHLEISTGGYRLMNQIPCPFLNGNTCSIYHLRFEDCRKFPDLQSSGFSQRAFGLMQHAARCPIVFNVVEALKINTGFIHSL